jgi:acyl-CoA synthetase (AMP-forming)/AMP-acid ligase II
LIKHAEDEHGFFVSALYGSSEALVNTAVTPDDAFAQRHGSDGKIIPGVAARLVHPDTGTVLPAGAEGELQVRTPVLFAGYYKDPEPTAFEYWLLQHCQATGLSDGPLRAMAREVLAEWRLATASPTFRQWLTQRAPSDDAHA